MCTCTDDEVPQIFRKTDLIMDTRSQGWTENCALRLDKGLGVKEEQYTKYNFEDPEGTFVDLTQNSEAYTGYNGTNIWPVVY